MGMHVTVATLSTLVDNKSMKDTAVNSVRQKDWEM